MKTNFKMNGFFLLLWFDSVVVRGLHWGRGILSSIALIITILSPENTAAGAFEFHGQVVSWAQYHAEVVEQSQIGVRFIPAFYGQKAVSATWQLSAEVSAHAYGFHTFAGWDRSHRDGELRLYRCWARLSSAQMEWRAGLQKIDFGSAMMLRPLMWFDRIDPRDPLQLTDGVYGLLLRYYFLNNANIWLWGLYGNDQPKGWEINASEAHKPEFGARLQWPVASGEIGVTYHRRIMDRQKGYLNDLRLGDASARENRYALDGKWDIGVGCWFEGVILHQQHQHALALYQQMITLGIDYTFAVGNGLHLTHEYLLWSSGTKALSSEELRTFSAASANYPLGILDLINVIIFYDWKHQECYRFANWRRSYDRWQLNMMAFWNPRQYTLSLNPRMSQVLSGKGIQVMISLHFDCSKK